MNDVPALFFEEVVSQFISKEPLLAGSALSGLPGHVVSDAYAEQSVHCMGLRNGRLEEESHFNWEDEPVDIETSNRKHLHYMHIRIYGDKKEYSTDPESTQRVLSATKGKHVLLGLQTLNISDEIAKCIESIRLVSDLKVDTKITSDVLEMMRLLMERHTLNTIDISDNVEIDDQTTQLLVDLLKQEQFHRIYLPAKCSAALKTIIASWRENSEAMVGKMIYCRLEFSKLQLPSSLRPLGFAALKTTIASWMENLKEMVGKMIYWRDEFPETELSTEFTFEECSEEEDERQAERAYPFAGFWPRITTKSVLRNQDGRAVCSFSRPTLDYKTVFVFA